MKPKLRFEAKVIDISFELLYLLLFMGKMMEFSYICDSMKYFI